MNPFINRCVQKNCSTLKLFFFQSNPRKQKKYKELCSNSLFTFHCLQKMQLFLEAPVFVFIKRLMSSDYNTHSHTSHHHPFPSHPSPPPPLIIHGAPVDSSRPPPSILNTTSDVIVLHECFLG